MYSYIFALDDSKLMNDMWISFSCSVLNVDILYGNYCDLNLNLRMTILIVSDILHIKYLDLLVNVLKLNLGKRFRMSSLLKTFYSLDAVGTVS